MNRRSSASAASTEEEFSLRLVYADWYMARELAWDQGRPVGVAANENAASGEFPLMSPVLRLYGSTPRGQKATVHVHGCYPYFYVPAPANVVDCCGDEAALDRFLKELEFNIDNAVNSGAEQRQQQQQQQQQQPAQQQQQNGPVSGDSQWRPPRRRRPAKTVMTLSYIRATDFYGYRSLESLLATPAHEQARTCWSNEPGRWTLQSCPLLRKCVSAETLRIRAATNRASLSPGTAAQTDSS